jgi:putative ABC transport system ATP-binding protein
MEPIIRAENISKIYGSGRIEVAALCNVNLSVSKGEFIAIMGASGSGKSTFMNIIGCLDSPTSGSYFLEGVDIKEKTQDELSRIRNQKIGFVFQSFNLIPRTSTVKNIEIPMIYAKIGAEERRRRALALLEKVELSDRGHHLPNELSGGQKQRVAIARALANDPPIILADEPTGNLDSHSSQEIMKIFAELNKNDGNSILIVTHERDIAEYTDRIVTFKDGAIIGDERK